MVIQCHFQVHFAGNVLIFQYPCYQTLLCSNHGRPKTHRIAFPKKQRVPLRPRSIIREHLQRYQMFQCRFQETHFYYFFHIQRPFFTCHFFDCIPNRIISPPTNAIISEKSALCSCINQFLLKNLRRRFNIGGC